MGRWAPRKDVLWSVEPSGDLRSVNMLEWGGAKDRQLAALLNKMSVRTPALTTRVKP